MKRLLLFLIPTILFAAPAQVILLRHAETPDATSTLSLKGRERAAALTPFFNGAPEVNFYGLPIAIYAPSNTPEATQTVQGLADDLGVSVISKYLQTQTDRLTKEILTNPDYEGHTVIVCWNGEQIPEIARKLGAKKTPKRWDGNDFDKLWILTINDDGQIAFQNQPQKLLYGDSK